MDFGIHDNGENMTTCKCEICEQERQIMEVIKAMFSEDLFNQTEKEEEMTDPQYTHKFTSHLGSGLSRCICSDFKHSSGETVKVFLCKRDERFESLDVADQNGNSLNGLYKHVERSKWDAVPVDAPVVISGGGLHANRHFAKFEEGLVWTWADGKTSHTTKRMVKWPTSDFNVELAK